MVVERKPVWNLLQFSGVCVSFVGFQMFWRLPFMVFGWSVAILVPFYLALLGLGVPIMYIQLKLGGLTRQGVVQMFAGHAPILKGFAVARLIQNFILSIFYNVITSHVIYYMFRTLDEPYPWAGDNSTTANQPGQLFVGEENYYYDHVLRMSSDLQNEGDIRWYLAASLVGAWFVSFFLTCGGMKYFGWTMVVLAYGGLSVTCSLLAYGREELNVHEPEKPFYTAEWGRITKDPEPIKDVFFDIWGYAALRAMHVIMAWYGVLPTMGKCAHNSPYVANWTWVILLLIVSAFPHLIINLLAPYLQALAEAEGVTMAHVMSSGTHILFAVLPRVFWRLQLNKGLAFAFYFVIFLFAAQKQALLLSVTADNIVEGWVGQNKKRARRKSAMFVLTCFLLCFTGFMFGIPLISQNGMYMVVLVDVWLEKLSFVTMFFSMIGFLVTYSRQKVGLFAKFAFRVWFVFASLLVGALLAYSAKIQDEVQDFVWEVRPGVPYVYSDFAYTLGWAIAGGPIVVGFLYGLIHAVGAARWKCGVVCCGQKIERIHHNDPDAHAYGFDEANIDVTDVPRGSMVSVSSRHSGYVNVPTPGKSEKKKDKEKFRRSTATSKLSNVTDAHGYGFSETKLGTAGSVQSFGSQHSGYLNVPKSVQKKKLKKSPATSRLGSELVRKASDRDSRRGPVEVEGQRSRQGSEVERSSVRSVSFDQSQRRESEHQPQGMQPVNAIQVALNPLNQPHTPTPATSASKQSYKPSPAVERRKSEHQPQGMQPVNTVQVAPSHLNQPHTPAPATSASKQSYKPSPAVGQSAAEPQFVAVVTAPTDEVTELY